MDGGRKGCMDGWMDGWMEGCVDCREGTFDVYAHSDDPPALSATENVHSTHQRDIVTCVVMLSEP